MDFSVGEIIGGTVAIAGVSAAFGALSHRLRVLEKQPSGETNAAELAASRKDQGQRIGDLEDRISKVEGFMLGTKYRRKTRPGGEPMP